MIPKKDQPSPHRGYFLYTRFSDNVVKTLWVNVSSFFKTKRNKQIFQVEMAAKYIFSINPFSIMRITHRPCGATCLKNAYVTGAGTFWIRAHSAAACNEPSFWVIFSRYRGCGHSRLWQLAAS